MVYDHHHHHHHHCTYGLKMMSIAEKSTLRIIREPDSLLHPDKPIQGRPAALGAPISHGSLTDPPQDQSCKDECVKLVGWKDTVHTSRDPSHVLAAHSFTLHFLLYCLCTNVVFFFFLKA